MSQQFSHLQTLQLPRLVAEGVKLMGISEIPGPKSNSDIMAWAREVGVGHIYSNDDIAWCGLFIAVIVQRSGRNIVKDPLWARKWAKWGVKADRPMLGDILVFRRGSGGHVGLYIAEDEQTFYVLGGNQGNRVSITRIMKDRLIDARRPIYNNRPESVRPYFVNASGAISTDEA